MKHLYDVDFGCAKVILDTCENKLYQIHMYK